MKTLTTLALTALTALTTFAPAAQAEAPVELCKDIYRQAAYETECFIPHQGYRTVGDYVAQLQAPAPAPAPVAAPIQRETFDQFMDKCLYFGDGSSKGNWIEEATYGNGYHCVGNMGQVDFWSPTGYGF